ncbi:hypothetical protein UFOVP1264_11 [uncultured Caudovirales phage]|uniref:Uncharacterized protein n=1 Tax=uncultured Caudovirales phage TaxID=2100421 RepID=A0A6J5RJP4_9CAUD|nr:hypothetical protein UFOVP1264_11 [uncultured Caudovirales phage]
MATVYKVLGQSNPAATTATTLYTVPSATSTVVSTITVANIGVSGTYRIAVRPAGATLANQHYVVYEASLNANDSLTFTLGLTLAATDVVTVYASTANFAFGIYGSEIS